VPETQGSGLRLASAPKGYTGEQHKSRPPAETVAWARERFQALGGGVLKETRRIDTGRLDIPVYISLCGPAASSLTGAYKQMGKGASPVQAEASALMELAERYSFFSFVDQRRPLLTPAQAQALGPVMPFEQILRSLHHPEQGRQQAKRAFRLLPQRWVWAANLAAGRDELVPLDWFYAINEYNGPAAGNRLEEAVLQSLCEVVERHVSAVATHDAPATPALDPASVADPVAGELLAKYRAAGVEVVLKDYTLGLGIPSVAALCWDPATFPHSSEIVYTAGTATSPAQALIRALTEVAQLAGDFQTGSAYEVSALPKFASLEEARAVSRSQSTAALADLPDVSAPDLYDEVAACVAALGHRGYTAYSLEVTHPRLGIPAVYTIVPGAHFAERTRETDCLFHAAKLASQLPDPAQAGRVLAEMARVGGESHYLPFFQALALINLGRPAEALELLDRALGLGPPPGDEASIHTQRGVALKDLGRFQEAKAPLWTAASYPEPHAEVFNLLGFCHYKLGEHEEAIEAFSRAVELDPGQAINYANIGSNLRELGRVEEACEMYRHALELDPGLGFARDNLARLSQGPGGKGQS
jgi:ribosomal protein S12 methylthiotransferase accessory factor